MLEKQASSRPRLRACLLFVLLQAHILPAGEPATLGDGCHGHRVRRREGGSAGAATGASEARARSSL